MKVIETGNYNISSKSTINVYGLIYNDTFTPYNPYANRLMYDRGDCDKDQFKLSMVLYANARYVLVITTLDPYVEGNFSIIASGPNNISFNLISKYLYYSVANV